MLPQLFIPACPSYPSHTPAIFTHSPLSSFLHLWVEHVLQMICPGSVCYASLHFMWLWGCLFHHQLFLRSCENVGHEVSGNPQAWKWKGATYCFKNIYFWGVKRRRVLFSGSFSPRFASWKEAWASAHIVASDFVKYSPRRSYIYSMEAHLFVCWLPPSPSVVLSLSPSLSSPSAFHPDQL